MELKEARISIRIDQDQTIIELFDNLSSITFCRVELTPEQLSSALSRLAYTKCKADVYSLDRLNKRMLVDRIVFELPKPSYQISKDELVDLANRNTPDGWICDLSFNSQDSFTQKDGKYFAKTIIRKWE